MPDAMFNDQRLADIYDDLDADRSDLDVYASMVAELGAASVLDVGCGTGCFAVLLAERGIAVTGVDPAEASLNVARRKPFANQVRWILGDATTLPSLVVDLVTMTGNVAQVFLTDDSWDATLRDIAKSTNQGGFLVFETRDPSKQAWLDWNKEATYARTTTVSGPVESWVDVDAISGDLVTFNGVVRFEATGVVLASTSTLRFRERHQIEKSLERVGYLVREIRDAPDRPGKEFVFVAELIAP